MTGLTRLSWEGSSHGWVGEVSLSYFSLRWLPLFGLVGSVVCQLRRAEVPETSSREASGSIVRWTVTGGCPSRVQGRHRNDGLPDSGARRTPRRGLVGCEVVDVSVRNKIVYTAK